MEERSMSVAPWVKEVVLPLEFPINETMMISTKGLILIVDDTPTNLDIISEALSDAGFDVAIATSGERALQQIARKPPNLILLDVMMPGIDGFETCQRLKANPETQDIPVIFMTALSELNTKIQALELGAVDYITKPFQEKEVLARVKTHLQLHYLTRNLESQVAQKTAELQASQLQLVQNEKMSALGNLVAGVAHEINNPVGFLAGNMKYALDYIDRLFKIINLYQQKYPDPDAELVDLLETSELEYLVEDLPKLLNSMQQGIDRIRHISNSLRTFARADIDQKQSFNLHDGLDSTLLILQHRIKANETRSTIEVIKDYGDLPSIDCFPGQMNQVFMNVLANAIDALDEASQDHPLTQSQAHPLQIRIQTQWLKSDHPDNQPSNNGKSAHNVAIIRISDNGKGMTDAVRQRIFDHLFTTKTVGKGTGLGLAIAHQIIVEKHGGTITVNSKPGHGAEFVIMLPLTSGTR
jgi:signal transduction histidine kinase